MNIQGTENIIISMMHNLEKSLNSEKIKKNVYKEVNNPFNFCIGIDHIISSSYSRSFSSSLGTNLQYAATDIAKLHGWDILNDGTSVNLKICGEYSDHTRKTINHVMKIINETQRTSNTVMDNFKSKISSAVMSSSSPIISRNADLILKKDNEIIIMELKSGGDLDKGKAKNQREELFELFAIMCSKYKNDLIQNKIIIKMFFATLYNKNDLFAGSENWINSSVTKNFTNDELLIGKDFWNYICNDENAYEIIIKLYHKHSNILKIALERLHINIKEQFKTKTIPEIYDI